MLEMAFGKLTCFFFDRIQTLEFFRWTPPEDPRGFIRIPSDVVWGQESKWFLSGGCYLD